MQTKYIDVHSHLYFKDFDEDREVVLERMRANGVATLTVGVDLKASKEALAFDKQHPDISLGVTVGQHPTNTEPFEKDAFDALIAQNKDRVKAMGECGLDYFRRDSNSAQEKERQKALFVAQIELAVKHGLPLMLHIRNSQGEIDAHKDAFEILKPYKEKHSELHLHLHFFTAPKEVVEMFLPLGATFGIPGVVTFAKEVQESVKNIPADRLMLESDAPYAAPVPHRGKRNEPVFIIDTLKHIAKIKKTDSETLTDIILNNSTKFFGLKI